MKFDLGQYIYISVINLPRVITPPSKQLHQQISEVDVKKFPLNSNATRYLSLLFAIFEDLHQYFYVVQDNPLFHSLVLYLHPSNQQFKDLLILALHTTLPIATIITSRQITDGKSVFALLCLSKSGLEIVMSCKLKKQTEKN